MKKAIIVTLAIFLLLSFSGCSKTAADNGVSDDVVKSEITKAAESFGLNADKFAFAEGEACVDLSAANDQPEAGTCVSIMLTIQKCLAENSREAKKIIVRLANDGIVKAYDMELKGSTVCLTVPSDGQDRCTAADVVNYMDAFAYVAYNMTGEEHEKVDIKLVNADGAAIYEDSVRFSKAAEKRTPAPNADPSTLAEPVSAVLPLGLELNGITVENHAGTPAVAITLKCSERGSASVQYINDVYNAVVSRSVGEMNIAACTVAIEDAVTGEQLMYYYGNDDIDKIAAWISPEILAASGPAGAGE